MATVGGGRLPELDLFKSLLVVGMIAAHVMQLLGRSLPGWTERFSEVINLVTFSGFLLAMGIGVGLAGSRSRPWWSRVRPVLMLLAAGYVSSFAFALLVDRERFGADLVMDVLTLRRLFGWSEFLATFAMLYAVIAVARPVLLWIAARPAVLIVAVGLCLMSCWLVINREMPVAATLVGTSRFANFPLLAYLPWFLVGVALGLAGGRLTIWHIVGAAIGTGWLVWGLVETGQWPGRFPPTPGWIVGSALPLLVYFWLCQLAARRVALPDWLTVSGRHVLSFLLLSNLLIFAARHLWDRPVAAVWSWLGVTALIVVGLGAGWLVWERRAAARVPGGGTAAAALR